MCLVYQVIVEHIIGGERPNLGCFITDRSSCIFYAKTKRVQYRERTEHVYMYTVGVFVHRGRCIGYITT